jgi:hypothetical protein
MTNSEASVTSSPGGSQSFVARTAAGEASALALAAWQTVFESLALSGFGHAATLAAMGSLSPVGASLSLPAAQPRSTSSARASVRLAGVFLPTPQPPSAALPSAVQSSLPLTARRSAAPAFTPRFAATRQRCRQSGRTANHALQRTVPRVTGAAVHVRSRLVRAGRCPTSVTSFFAPPAQLPRRAPRSLSLGSLAVISRVPIL